MKVKVALIQMASEGKSEANLEKALARIEEAAGRGANIVSLQELFRSDYFCRSEDARHFELAEPVPGPSTDALSQAARKHGVVIIAPLFEKRTEGIYHNSAVVIDTDGKITGKYRKMHIPDDPGFYEKFYFTPGDLGFKAYPTRFGKIAVLICWDQWFPEAARLAALDGAKILFYPTAIGWHKSERPEARQTQLAGWEIVQRGHAVANGVYVAVTNRVGAEGDITFWGRSFVADPFGTVLGQADGSREETLRVDCDLDAIEIQRQNWPFLRDRRVDAYAALTERFLDG